ERALQDQLTGLPNRALLEDRLGHALRTAVRRGTPLAVFFIDLDGFKAVNDTHGHAVGDGLLSLVAAFLRAAMRNSDTVARLGGDEFVVLCEDLQPQAQPIVVDRLRTAVESADGEAQVGLSVGIVQATPEQTMGDVLSDADRLMYADKQSRRQPA
ncbi:MAG: GGDEF domain-containing protein, partial [Angustibacter sp.]